MRKTLVTKANPTIRTIVSAVPHGDLGKRFDIKVLEVPPSWKLSFFFGDQRRVYYLELPELEGGRIADEPSGVRSEVKYPAPDRDEVLVIVSPRIHEIMVVVREDALDSAAISIATDALLEKDKQAAAAAVGEMGLMAGIGLAIAEAQTKALGMKERGIVPKQHGRAAQLEREIEAALARRMAPSHLRKLLRR
jgi:hypothetical protein